MELLNDIYKKIINNDYNDIIIKLEKMKIDLILEPSIKKSSENFFIFLYIINYLRGWGLIFKFCYNKVFFLESIENIINKRDRPYIQYLNKIKLYVNNEDKSELIENMSGIKYIESVEKIKLKMIKILKELKKIEISKELEIEINEKTPLLLNYERFEELCKRINNRDLLEELNIKYFYKINKLLIEYLIIIILTRHNLSTQSKYKNYLSLIRKDNKGEYKCLKNIIIKISDYYNERTNIELERLKKLNNNNKLNTNSIFSIINKIKPNILFTPGIIIDTILNIFSIFNIKYELGKEKSSKLWKENLTLNYINFKIKDNYVGKLYLDLIKNKTDDINFIHLCQKNKNFNIDETTMVIVANFKGFNVKCININDVKNLFNEFSKVFYYLYNKNGYKNTKVENMMKNIMEYYLWKKTTITSIIKKEKDYDESVIDKILFYGHSKIGIISKLNCINSLFDIKIHNSLKLIDYMSDTKNNICDKIIYLNNIYIKIFKKIFNNSLEILSLDEIIKPRLILKESSNNACKITSYLWYNIIYLKLINCIRNGNGEYILETLCNTNIKNFDDILTILIKEYGDGDLTTRIIDKENINIEFDSIIYSC